MREVTKRNFLMHQLDVALRHLEAANAELNLARIYAKGDPYEKGMRESQLKIYAEYKKLCEIAMRYAQGF